MDLSKVYDCLPHDLIIAKLEAYGLSRSSLNLMYTVHSRYLELSRGSRNCSRHREFEIRVVVLLKRMVKGPSFLFETSRVRDTEISRVDCNYLIDVSKEPE